MKVAIIGAGNVGKALATSMTRAGYDVTITAKSADSARQAAQEVGASPAESPAEAAEQADMIVLAIPYVGAADDVAAQIRDRVAGKTIIDVTNPLTPDYSGLAVETSAAEEIQEKLPNASVVKAFNTIFASNQANPSEEIDAFVAADDESAKSRVIDLARAVGFNPLDVGPLKAARHLEGMAYLNIGLNAQHGWDWTSSWKLDR